MKIRVNITLAFILCASGVASMLCVWSCGRTITDPAEIIIPASDVRFERHLLPVFNLTCNDAGCHSSESRAGGVALTSYFEVVFNTPGLVVAKNPDRSVLMRVLDFNAATRIPHRQSFQNRITQNHIDGVRTWIREGAQ
jgi:hypothetical protein